MPLSERHLQDEPPSETRNGDRPQLRICEERPLEETDASGSNDNPCRSVRLCPHPVVPPHAGALSSHEFPPKTTMPPCEGHDEMGPWILLSPDSWVYYSRNAIHLTSLCDALPLEGIPAPLCYCISKIYKKMHYMIGYDGCLHEACGCSLDCPPVYNPMHLRPSMVRVCRACFSIPPVAADSHPELVG